MATHCCDTMAGYIDPKCPDHPDPKDCEDAPLTYDSPAVDDDAPEEFRSDAWWRSRGL